jgi:[ribosomal protein S5]-alanine N-acetyltransferase
VPIVPELRTERLLLRAYRPEDVAELVPLVGAAEVAATTLRIPHPYTAEDAHAFLNLLAGDPTLTRFGIWVAETNEMCGGIGLNLELPHRRAELGYWIGVPFWGKGYCSEAAQEIVRYGFQELELNRIYAHHFSGNDASGRVLRKLGMKYEGQLRQHIVKSGRLIDLECYGLLASEWRTNRPAS